MTKTLLITSVLTLGLITEAANADFIFGTPTNLGSLVNSTAAEQGPSLSVDGLELYFSDHSPDSSQPSVPLADATSRMRVKVDSTISPP